MAVDAYERLESMIILDKLQPGVRLSEKALSQNLGLGRTPIREALQKLRENQLVEIIPRLGVFVTKLDFRDQLLVLEVRRDLEATLVRRTNRLASPADRASFREMAATIRSAVSRGDKRLLMKVDRRYKDLCLEIAANRFLEAALAPIHAHSRRFFFTHIATTSMRIGEAHAAIMDAIGRGDGDGALRANQTFLDAIEEFTRAALAREIV